jgi:uncharacterized protein
MPRPKRIRRVTRPPHYKGFKPIGISVNASPVIMNYEEYEAIRLNDFELLGQVAAAQVMNVSRPTYTRIYESARRKVAQAFVNGQPLVFEGGKVYFDSDWYKCNDCGCYFNHPEKDQKLSQCALCGSDKIGQILNNFQENTIEYVCICPRCGKEKDHFPGTPCREEICPDCNCRMIRKENLQNKEETNN